MEKWATYYHMCVFNFYKYLISWHPCSQGNCKSPARSTLPSLKPHFSMNQIKRGKLENSICEHKSASLIQCNKITKFKTSSSNATKSSSHDRPHNKFNKTPNHKLFTVKLASYKYAIIYKLKQECNHMYVFKINLREDVGMRSCVCVCFCVGNVLCCVWQVTAALELRASYCIWETREKGKKIREWAGYTSTKLLGVM